MTFITEKKEKLIQKEQKIITMGMGEEQNIVTLGAPGVIVRVFQIISKKRKASSSVGTTHKSQQLFLENTNHHYVIRSKLVKVNNFSDFLLIEGEIKKQFNSIEDISLVSNKIVYTSSNNEKISVKANLLNFMI